MSVLNKGTDYEHVLKVGLLDNLKSLKAGRYGRWEHGRIKLFLLMSLVTQNMKAYRASVDKGQPAAQQGKWPHRAGALEFASLDTRKKLLAPFHK